MMEVLLNLLCPIPFVDEPDKVLCLFMFLRLYIVFKVARDHSAIYKKRHLIQRIPGYSPATHPSFNSLLTMKMFFYQNPIIYVITWILFGIFILSYGIYVFERLVVVLK